MRMSERASERISICSAYPISFGPQLRKRLVDQFWTTVSSQASQQIPDVTRPRPRARANFPSWRPLRIIVLPLAPFELPLRPHPHFEHFVWFSILLFREFSQGLL
ncbi:hypothetical protein MPTK1_5g04480 [Marchantia polymorpha subsp. ruderalis]|uniref:Uncharacterized protein n=2 Tax=Marchantia polymorpha TaxID=3197 RepID=A0AAF6BEX1_MARPO|nr:hypothetical protein MARPO_0027s0178 [Marchantia polymorpha]PTQ43081.1 hypothetical protein MARPO_0027s0178 [Marchantia polymorpha]BBN10554.1 hypothetical protein Mp_5g04480 [Marchantia polymorpha subsp. ruderalis]BBN10555.1 hypothetical protein Mp_5g04480 [Marchantia polymorpha subsp. ruderalis]|eukprot:PTQ43080.1 hypothetical protein MARPO_0027s0178 [Marchantia polymorpha]